MPNFYNYFVNNDRVKTMPNQWDGIALVLVLGIVSIIAWGAKQMSTPYHIGETIAITLNPQVLPDYGLLTVMRMLIAMIFSLLFTFIFGTWAARKPLAGKIIIPCIDVLQSVPVIGMLSVTVSGFIALFPGSRLGPECASIFTVFISQVWNMTLSFYQSLRTVPAELREVSAMFHLSAWQRFWRIEVPFAMPGLLWNMMLSMSASWFFVVISEAISVANQQINLPGIGSYLGLAISQANIHAVIYAITAMLIIILLYDQLLFRPLLAWAEKFKAEQTAQEKTMQSWVITLLRRTRILQQIGQFFGVITDRLRNLRLPKAQMRLPQLAISHHLISKSLQIIGYLLLLFGVVTVASWLVHFIFSSVPHEEFSHVVLVRLYDGHTCFGYCID